MKIYGSYILLIPKRIGDKLFPLKQARKLRSSEVHCKGKVVGFIDKVREARRNNSDYWEAEVKITDESFRAKSEFVKADFAPYFEFQETSKRLADEKISSAIIDREMVKAEARFDEYSIKSLRKQAVRSKARQKELRLQLEKQINDAK